MPALTLDALRHEGDRFHQALSREHYLAASGLKPTAELQPIYAQFASVVGRDALDFARAGFLEMERGSEEHRSLAMLLEWLVGEQASRELAPLDERTIAWEAGAVVRTAEGREVPYARIAIEIASSPDRAERAMLDEARAALVARELAPMKRERLERERDMVEALDIAPGYLATFEALSGIALGALAGQCRRLLADTDALWTELFRDFVTRPLGLAAGEATRADALALMRAPRFDAYFPAAALQGAIRRNVEEMGIDPEASGRIRYDVEERPGKRARAFCAPVRVPDEVHLVLRPHGGATDYRTLLHELGHALHFANAARELPFEYRWLGDNSVTEGYAMLFDHRMQDRGWLLRYSELEKGRVGDYLRAAAFEELQFVRRYAGKLLYEMELYSGATSWSSLSDLYVETLGRATSFRYQSADAFVDVDPGFYAARYLRAWQLQAALAEALVERFDVDWYRNPRSGPWMVSELFAAGQRERATELAERVGAQTLSFDPVVRGVEAALAA